MSRGMLQGAIAYAAAGRQSRQQNIQNIMAIQRHKQSQNYMAMAQQELGIRLQSKALDLQQRRHRFGKELDAVAHEKHIQEALSSAVQQGGYEQGIEVLKKLDPNRAIQFHSEKLKLDNAILGNETMQAVSSLEKQKALLESYEVAGRYANQILQLPKNQQRRAFKILQPGLKAVIPNIAEELNPEVETQLRLLQAQGLPQNQINVLQKKIAQDEASDVDATKDRLDLMIKRQRLVKNELDATRNFQSDLDDASRSFNEKVDVYKGIIPLLRILETNPTHGSAQTQLQTLMARAGGEKGPLSDSDIKRLNIKRGYRAVSARVKAALQGEVIALDPKEIEQMRQIVEEHVQQQQNSQLLLEKQFQDKLKGNERFQTLVRFQDIIRPSKRLEALTEERGPQPDQQDIQEALQDPQAKQEFIDYFGKTPEEFAQ